MPLRHDGKAFLGEVFFDIAARRVRQLRQGMAKRLEAIGGLAAGIAHEINTPVQYIGDSMTFLTEAGEDMDRLFDLYRELERTAPDTPGLRDVRDRIRRTAAEIDAAFLLEEIPRARARITEGVARITDIVLALKRFAHPGGEEKRLVDLNRALEDTVTVTRNEWKYAARLETDLDRGLPLVPAHAGDLSQVFLNLMVNAAQAVAEAVGDSGEKGLIRVKTRLSGDRAVVCVSDTGPGVPQALQETIFDPFFTTKEVGKGTGQGLALVHDIVVNKHGGTVRLESSPGQGATFTVELPLAARENHPEAT
jgi:signal transduction histidine kinase